MDLQRETKQYAVIAIVGDAQPATLSGVFGITVSFPSLAFPCKSGF